MTTLRFKNAFKELETPQQRKDWARYLWRILTGLNTKPESEPWMINRDDSTYWKFDPGNDWGVKFYDQHPNTFSLCYRYDSAQHPLGQKLADWLMALHSDLEIAPDL